MKKAIIALLFASSSLLMLASCAPPAEEKPKGPQSNINTIPWNRGLDGEGGGAFGGALNPR